MWLVAPGRKTKSLKYVLLVAAALSIGAALIIAIYGPWGGGLKETASLFGTSSPPGAANQVGPAGPVAPGPEAPELGGITAWINIGPLTIQGLRGKVVLLDFWTYSCVNCIRTFPYLKQWHARYADDGLVILGVHTPEFNFETKLENVMSAVRDNDITWLVALDNEHVTWDSYDNLYWPAKYLIDQDGVVRHAYFGEGGYATMERKIQELLVEAGADLSGDELPLPPDHAVDPDFFI
jgi:thiol-disulfide isomerase/thioredoxin